MKTLRLLPLILLAACARLELKVVNCSGAPVKQIEIRSPAGNIVLPVLDEGASHIQVLKLKSGGDINVNYSNAQGQQLFTSSAISLRPGDSGFVLLSITAKGTLDSLDGRKK